jgi:hypothetical protein
MMSAHQSPLPSFGHPHAVNTQEGARGGTLNIQLHRLPTPSIDAWVWHISTGKVLHHLSEEDLHALRKQGWELFDPRDISNAFLALISQLADTIPVAEKTLVKMEAVTAAERFPVVLAFAHQDITHPSVLPGPLTQIGELGIVFDDLQEYHTYTAEQIGTEGIRLCQDLRAALNSFLSLKAETDPRDTSWSDAQAIARELAARYWDYHQRALGMRELETSAPSDEATFLPSTKRVRKSLPPATNVLVGEPSEVTIPFDPVTQALMASLLDRDRYQQHEDFRYAEYTPVHAKNRDVRITIRPGSGEEWDSVLKSLNTLGDPIVDTFCALLAIAIDVNKENISDAFFLDVDDILQVCQRKKSNRTFTPLQRLQVVEHLQTLEHVHITASRPGEEPPTNPGVGKMSIKKRRKGAEGGGTVVHFDSVVVDLLGTVIGEYRTLTGEPLWERREVRIGPWAQLAPSLSQQTALMLRKVLAYHGQRQRHEKRIGRWLTLQFQVPSGRNAGYVECSTQTLVEQSGIKVNFNAPNETRADIEEAVEKLLKDNIIGAYQRVIIIQKPVRRVDLFEDVLDHDDPPMKAGVQVGSEDYWKAVRLHIKIGSEEAREIRSRIDQRARLWWALYAEHVWWRFEPPLPQNMQERKQIVSGRL